MMISIKQGKPKILNTLDSVIANLQAENSLADVEWQAMMIARECLASSSVMQLASAIEIVSRKLKQKEFPKPSPPTDELLEDDLIFERQLPRGNPHHKPAAFCSRRANLCMLPIPQSISMPVIASEKRYTASLGNRLKQ
jgi:hypothetical protein